MKKFFVIAFAATMLFAGHASAQVKAGIKAGLNLTSMSLSEKMFSSENRAGFFVGPTVNFTLPVVGLALDASLLYDQRSAKMKYVDDANNELGNTVKQKALNVPINVRYGLGLGSTASIYLFAGPQFGFNVGSKDFKWTDGSSYALKSTQFSINVGLGVMLMKHLQLSANYNIALGKTGELTPGTVIKDIVKGQKVDEGRINAWQISAAYLF